MSTQIDSRRRRRGTAAVELAVSLPVLVILALGTVETCGMLFLGQSLKIASYEGARVGVVPKAEAGNVVFQCESILDSRSIDSYQIQLTPGDPASLDEGQDFVVTVTANYGPNSWVGGWVFDSHTIERSTTLRAN